MNCTSSVRNISRISENLLKTTTSCDYFSNCTCITMHIHDKSCKKVQVSKDQENAQSEKDSHSKNRGGKNQTNNQVLIP